MTGTHTPSTRGFTLIELMMALTIVMVLLTLALPNVMGDERIRFMDGATGEVKEIVEFTRNRAVNDASAYGLVITPTGGAEPGALAVFRGTDPACGSINTGGTPIRTLDLGDFADVDDDVSVRLTRLVPQGLQMLCFTPDGRTVRGTPPFQPVQSADAAYAAGDAVLVLELFLREDEAGIPHNVIIPFSGKPRVTYGDDEDGTWGEGGA